MGKAFLPNEKCFCSKWHDRAEESIRFFAVSVFRGSNDRERCDFGMPEGNKRFRHQSGPVLGKWAPTLFSRPVLNCGFKTAMSLSYDVVSDWVD